MLGAPSRGFQLLLGLRRHLRFVARSRDDRVELTEHFATTISTGPPPLKTARNSAEKFTAGGGGWWNRRRR